MTDPIKENYTESIQTKIAAAEALPDAIHTAAQMLTICLLNGHKVMACGNGPSAALAQLFISELVNCYETERPSLPGMALTPDMATISAIATDHGFEEVYAKQIRALGEPGDILVVLTTTAGLWSYMLGDTVRFTARDPLRLVITGRTRHFVNAFGENVIVEEVEQALLEACRITGADVAEFTVAPRFPDPHEPRGGHEWLVEFRTAPPDGRRFVDALDAALRRLNTDYRTKRAGDLGMVAPVLRVLPAGAFHRWMVSAGKLGDQHKVPRVTNGRTVADALLASSGLAAVSGGQPRAVAAVSS